MRLFNVLTYIEALHGQPVSADIGGIPHPYSKTAKGIELDIICERALLFYPFAPDWLFSS